MFDKRMKYNDFKGVIYAIIILSISLTILQGYFPFFQRLWLTTAIGAIVVSLISPTFIHKKAFPCLLLYIIFIMLNYLIDDSYFGNIGNVVFEASSLILVCSMFFGLIRDGGIKPHGYVVFSFLGVLIFTSVASFFVDQINPGAIRQAFGANVTGADKQILTFYYKLGLSNYTLPHAVPVMIPCIVFGIKFRKNYHRVLRLLLWIALLCLLLLAYLSSSTTALIFAIVSLIISFSIRPGKEKGNLIRIIVLLLVASPLLMNKSIQIGILDATDIIVGENIYFHRKIDYFRESLSSENADIMESRDYLYEMSLNEFFSHPIIGTNSTIGGHSSLLDRLASLGIIGFVPFALFIVAMYKTSTNYIEKDDRLFYVVGFVIGILMCIIKSSWYWEMHFSMFVFLPSSIILFRRLSERIKS